MCEVYGKHRNPCSADVKATSAMGCFSQQAKSCVRCVRCMGCVRCMESTQIPSSAGVVLRPQEQQRGTAPLPCPQLPQHCHCLILGRWDRCRSAPSPPPGDVAGKFPQEAATTRSSSCLSMPHRTRGSSAAPDGAFPPLLHLCVCLDTHLASAICGRPILKRQRGEKKKPKNKTRS